MYVIVELRHGESLGVKGNQVEFGVVWRCNRENGSKDIVMLLFMERVHICSPHNDRPSTKGPGLSEGAYILVILSISVVVVFASLLVLS